MLRHLWDGGTYAKAPSLADENTMKRWRKEFSLTMTEWTGLLEGLIFMLCGHIPGVIRLSSHPLQNLEQALSFLPVLPGQWTVMAKALWWLKKPHPL